jgi:hypothetical protein
MTAMGYCSTPQPFLTGQGPTVSFRSFEDDNGGFYLTWSDLLDGKVVGLCAQHIDPSGHAAWGDAGLCISAHLASATDWNGLADGRGGLVLFWDEKDGVHAQRFHPENAQGLIGHSLVISTSTALQPDAVADAQGGTLLVWREALPSGRDVLMAQRMDTEGNPIWPKGGLRVSLRQSNQTNPRVIYDNQSGMIVAWRDEANQASELRVQRIDFSANRLWKADGLRVTEPVGVSEYPQIAPLGVGAAVVAWNGPANQTNQIFLQKAGPDAAIKWGNKTLASNIPIQYNRWNPVLLGDEQGRTWIGWEDFRNQVNYQIELNHLDQDGKSVWPNGEIAVAPALGEQGKMAMAGDLKKGVWLAWIDSRKATVGLYVQEIDPDGKPLQGSQGRMVADQLTKPSFPQIIAIGPGRAAISWSDRPKKNGPWELYWALVDAAPPNP